MCDELLRFGFDDVLCVFPNKMMGDELAGAGGGVAGGRLAPRRRRLTTTPRLSAVSVAVSTTGRQGQAACT